MLQQILMGEVVCGRRTGTFPWLCCFHFCPDPFFSDDPTTPQIAEEQLVMTTGPRNKVSKIQKLVFHFMLTSAEILKIATIVY